MHIIIGANKLLWIAASSTMLTIQPAYPRSLLPSILIGRVKNSHF